MESLTQTSISIIDKNIAIAEMLGAVKENWYPPNKDNNSSGDYWVFPHGKFFPNGERHCGDKFLKFHSDANWQFEAIDFLQKKNFNIIFAPFHDETDFDFSGEYWCQILQNSMDINKGCIIDITGCASNKEAIFEALYQFSQYLKQKK